MISRCHGNERAGPHGPREISRLRLKVSRSTRSTRSQCLGVSHSLSLSNVLNEFFWATAEIFEEAGGPKFRFFFWLRLRSSKKLEFLGITRVRNCPKTVSLGYRSSSKLFSSCLNCSQAVSLGYRSSSKLLLDCLAGERSSS